MKKNNNITLAGLYEVSAPDLLGRIVTLTGFLASCTDFSFRCEPDELFILETNRYHIPTLFYRKDGESFVTEYRMKCNREDFYHSPLYDVHRIRMEEYFDDSVNRKPMTDDIFLSGECPDLFDEIAVYQL